MAWPYIEIGAADADRMLEFFGSVMGWDVAGEGEGRHFVTPDGPVGVHGDDTPMAVVYFPVADLDAALDAVRRSGGAVTGGVTDEPGFGRFATCIAPQGVRFGLHQRP